MRGLWFVIYIYFFVCFLLYMYVCYEMFILINLYRMRFNEWKIWEFVFEKKKWERREKKERMELLRWILKLGDNEILIWFLID